MKRLTERQKNVLTVYGESYLYYIHENVMLTGGESEEVANRSNGAGSLRSEMQAAITALCEMLDIKYTIDNLYGSSYVLNFWDKNGLDLLFIVNAIISF